MYRKGKDIRKKDIIFLSFQICAVTNSSAPSCFCFVPSVFGEWFPTAKFLMISAETPCWEIKR
jgi:hypothetical protein